MEEAISPNLGWRLLGPGSAGYYLEIDGQDVELRTSYLGEALRGLMRAAVDLKVGSSSALAYFLGEPGGYRMVFSGGEQGEIYIQVVYFPDLQSEGREWMDGKILWAGVVHFSCFWRLLISIVPRPPSGRVPDRGGELRSFQAGMFSSMVTSPLEIFRDPMQRTRR